MAGPEPPGSARHATTLNRPAPEVSNLPPVPAHYGIYRTPDWRGEAHPKSTFRPLRIAKKNVIAAA